MNNKNSITKLHFLSFFSNLSFSYVIWMIYLQEAGLSLFQATILQSVLNFGMFFLEIPTGILADKYGRKSSLILGYLCIMLQASLLLLVPHLFSVQLIGFLFAGFGYALLSGTSEAILYDSIQDAGLGEKTTKIVGLNTAISMWAFVLAMFVGGFLGNISGKLVYLAVFSARFIALLISFTIKNYSENKSSHEEEQEPEKESLKKHFLEYALILKEQKKHLSLFLSLALFITIISLYFLFAQQTFVDVNIPIFYIGIILGVGHLFSGIGSSFAHRLEEKFTLPFILKTVLLLSSLLYPLLFVTHSTVYAVAFILISTLFGIADPFIFKVINEKFESKHRTALNSTFNFLSSFLMFALGPVLGFFTSEFRITLGVYIGIFGIIISLLAFLFFQSYAKKNKLS